MGINTRKSTDTTVAGYEWFTNRLREIAAVIKSYLTAESHYIPHLKCYVLT